MARMAPSLGDPMGRLAWSRPRHPPHCIAGLHSAALRGDLRVGSGVIYTAAQFSPVFISLVYLHFLPHLPHPPQCVVPSMTMYTLNYINLAYLNMNNSLTSSYLIRAPLTLWINTVALTLMSKQIKCQTAPELLRYWIGFRNLKENIGFNFFFLKQILASKFMRLFVFFLSTISSVCPFQF